LGLGPNRHCAREFLLRLSVDAQPSSPRHQSNRRSMSTPKKIGRWKMHRSRPKPSATTISKFRGTDDVDYHPNLGGATARMARAAIFYGSVMTICASACSHAAPLTNSRLVLRKSRRLNEGDLVTWNRFVSKLGWRHFATPRIAETREEAGIADCEEIVTVPEMIDCEEGRRSWQESYYGRRRESRRRHVT
jgi:hypothetical protein